jgi:hypothetical protein
MDALDKLVEFSAIAAIAIVALALWDKAAAQRAAENTQLMAQRGYTALEVDAGAAAIDRIFGS